MRDCEDEDAKEWPLDQHYVINCVYDLAGDILEYQLTNFKGSAISELSPKDSVWESKGILKSFYQNEFVDP